MDIKVIVEPGEDGYLVALRPTLADGFYEIYFGTHRITAIDLRHS